MTPRPRRTKQQAIAMRDKCRAMRSQGMKLREIAECLGVHISRATYYANYAK